MIIRLGFREFRRDFLLNLLVILQMAVMLLIGIAAISSLESRFTYYRPFAHYFSQDGIIAAFEDFGLPARAEDIETALDNRVQIDMEYQALDGFTEFNLRIIDDSILASFTPELTDGRFVMSDESSPYAQAIAPESLGYHVGEIVTGADFGKTVQISGLYSDNAVLPVFNPKYAEQKNFRMLFGTSESINGKGVFVSRSEAKKLDCTMICENLAFITYPDGADIDRMRADLLVLTQYGLSYSYYNFDVYANSLRYVYAEVIALVPVLIGILILLIISMVSVNAVTTERQLRSYAVYRLGGLTWQGCRRIAAVKACFVSAAALLLAGILFLLRAKLPFMDSFYFTAGMPQVLCIAGMILLNLLISGAISAVVLYRAKINQTLKEAA